MSKRLAAKSRLGKAGCGGFPVGSGGFFGLEGRAPECLNVDMEILIIGGNRFFGRHLAESFLRDKHKGQYKVTLLNRGTLDDGFVNQVTRLKGDRKIRDSLGNAVAGKSWDLVFDQVCYSASEAQMACEIFRNKTRRYIVTSSESIYDHGSNLKEEEFKPGTYHFENEALPNIDYQEAKKQVETVFARSKFAEVVMVRPSLVVGLDDYSGRLQWHLERIAKGQALFFPNLNIESDFIRSDQAGLALKTIGLSNHVGPVNCTSPGSIVLKDLLGMCEEVLKKPALLATKADDDNHSPYGGSKTKTMNTDLLRSLGADIEPSKKWMKALITEIAQRL
jgi:nucleoside-diphosphate-sugar epimerase